MPVSRSLIKHILHAKIFLLVVGGLVVIGTLSVVGLAYYSKSQKSVAESNEASAPKSAGDPSPEKTDSVPKANSGDTKPQTVVKSNPSPTQKPNNSTPTGNGGSSPSGPAPSSTPTPPVGSPKPSQSNTGPQAGIVLGTHNGDYYMNTNGQSISNLHITGSLYMGANNITATNVLVDGSVGINAAPGGNYFYPVKSNQTLNYVRAQSLWTIGLKNLTIRNSHFGSTADRLVQLTNYSEPGKQYEADGVVFENNLLDNPYQPAPSDHVEAIHVMSVSNGVFRNNVFDYVVPGPSTPPDGVTGTVVFQDSPFYGRNDNIVFDGNWLTGGGYYQIYALIWGNSSVTNNRFTSMPGQAGVLYPSRGSFSQSGNTFDGQPISL